MVKWARGEKGESQLYSVPVPQVAFPLLLFSPVCLSAWEYCWRGSVRGIKLWGWGECGGALTYRWWLRFQSQDYHSFAGSRVNQLALLSLRKMYLEEQMKYNPVVRSLASEDRETWVWIMAQPFMALWPWARLFDFLSISFIFHKVNSIYRSVLKTVRECLSSV